MRYHSLVDDDEDASALTDDSLLRAVAGAPPRAPAEPPLAAGTILGGFRVVSKVGAGGMGVVYRAEDEQLRRDVALKVIASARDSSPTERRRFLREARSAAAVNHPNVATIFEVGEDAGRIFIAMELVSGITLRSKLAEVQMKCLNKARSICRNESSSR